MGQRTEVDRVAGPQGGNLRAAQSSATGHSSQRRVRSKARGAPLCCWRRKLWKSGGQWQGPRGSRGEADFVLTLFWELGCPWQLSGKRAAQSDACLGRAPPAGGGGQQAGGQKAGAAQGRMRGGPERDVAPRWKRHLVPTDERKKEQISVCVLLRRASERRWEPNWEEPGPGSWESRGP